MSEFRSPRKVEEDIKKYRRDRFETYMEAVDRGELTRELALAAFREEDSVLLWVDDGNSQA